MSKTIATLLVFLLPLTLFAQEKISKTVYHPLNKATLTPASEAELQQFLQQVRSLHVTTVVVNAYADKTGSPAYNMQLSLQRSKYVASLLQQQLAGDIKLETNAYGSDQLLSGADDEQERNRRTEIIAWYTPEQKTTVKQDVQPQIIQLAAYREDVPEQRFSIDLDDTVSITAQHGTYLKFPPATFINKSNEVARGKATLVIKEYYTPAEILLAGMHSMSGEGLLQSGGMFKTCIIQGKDTMQDKTAKPVLVRMNDVNNLGGNMNVFVMDHGDTVMWSNTGKSFSWQNTFWNFPLKAGKLRDFIPATMGLQQEDRSFTAMPIGKADEEIFIYKSRVKNFRSLQYKYKNDGNTTKVWGYKPLAKTISYTIKKIDSATLHVSFHEKFRGRGYRQFSQRDFDTSFIVKHVTATYTSYVDGLNYINCDRFYNIPDKTEIYVTTPGFEGAQLLIYFSNLNAFMSPPVVKGKYAIPLIPVGEKVQLIAVGKKDDAFYYTKLPYTIARKGKVTLNLQQVNYDDMKQMFSTLGYKK